MDTQSTVNILAWAFVIVGSGLVSCLIWFALRVVAQLDRLEQLVVGEIHQHDLRLTKLETWRDSRDPPRGDGG